MEQRVSLVTLGVADLSASRAFYRRLGWRESSVSNESIAFFACGPMALALYGRAVLAADTGITDAGPAAFNGVTLAHNVRHRDDVAAVLAEAVAAGATLVKPAQDAHWGGHHGYFADLDGHLWEVAFNPFVPLDGSGGFHLP